MKKKILFLVQLPPPVHGASIVNQYIKKGKYINSTYETKFLNISPTKDISDIGHVKLLKIFKTLYIFYKNIYLMLFFRPDLIYITLAPHGPAFWKDSILLLLTKLFNCHRVIHLHGKGIAQQVNKNRLKRLYYKYVFKGCSVIHLASSVIQDISLIVEDSKISILPNGVPDTSSKSNAVTTEINSPLRVIYLSNFIREKGALEFLKSIPLVHAQKDSISFFFIGKFDKKEFEIEFKSVLSKLADKHNITLIEGAYNEEKSKLLEQSDIFILPTYYRNECFPLAILEAFCHGLPVISTYEGAIPDIIKDGWNGLLIEKASPESISKGIDLLFNSPNLLAQMKANARTSYKENYSLDIFEQRLIAIFSRCIG